MRKRSSASDSGHILQISSVGGRTTAPGLAPYQTSKWAVEGFSGVIAKELAPIGVKVTAIEPGGFRTDWAGSSMSIGEIPGDYEPSVGVLARHLEDGHGHEPGDPERAAHVLLQLADVDDPPLRLILGRAAFAMAREADQARIASDERWKDLSFATDFDDRGAAVEARPSAARPRIARPS